MLSKVDVCLLDKYILILQQLIRVKKNSMDWKFLTIAKEKCYLLICRNAGVSNNHLDFDRELKEYVENYVRLCPLD